jgi:outer membrane murein-binding lipoprotein Lpp
MRRAQWMLVAAGMLLAGCGDKAKTDQASGGTKTDTMAGMDMGKYAGMMPGMRAHMDSMAQASPEQMRSMMTSHQEMGSRMLDAMGADMRSMNMKSDAAWTALSDSVRSDLAELPGLHGAALKQRVQGHTDRVKRLMDRHEAMMGGMQPK